MTHRLMVATLKIADDLLFHRQPAGDHIEFDPTLEGEAADELLLIEPRPCSATPRSAL